MYIIKVLKISKLFKRTKIISDKYNLSPLIRRYKLRFFSPFYFIFKKYSPLMKILFESIPQFLLPFIYAGKDVKCLCCGWNGKKFLQYGSRINAKCPNCGALERSRLIYMYLESKFKFFHLNLKILDIGPDIHFQDQLSLFKNFNYVSIDSSNPRIMIRMDATKMTFSNAQFDVILCSNVLEHIKDDKAAISEIFRVLKPEGFALILVPIGGEKTFEDPTISPEDYAKYYGCSAHVRLYGLDIIDKLELAGFKVKIDYFAKNISRDKLKKYGINSQEIIFFCSK